jgi:protein JSN1
MVQALNGCDVLGSDVGAIRIGFANVPVKNGQYVPGQDDAPSLNVPGVGDLSCGSDDPRGGTVEDYRSNLLMSQLTTPHL